MFVQGLTYCILWILVFIFSTTLRILIGISNLTLLFTNEDIGDRFDYVIVGGGSAGAILAARLSEIPNVSVLLIEGGSDGFDILNVPVLGPLKQLSDLDWQYTTVSQKYSCRGLTSNVSKWPSGKILGGSTHLNYMIYLKGHKQDYVTWKDPDSSHWDYRDISFYFKKALRYVNIPSVQGKKDYCQEKDGSILVRRRMAHTTELSGTILQAAAEINYTLNDLNSGLKGTGFMKPHLNVDERGKRWTSDQYLKRVKRQRKNLKFLTNAVAEKILLKNKFEAYAVKFKRGGKSETVLANIEIIVCAGAVGSAKLLMLSGIGPEKVLAKAKIEPKIDLPVGRNLQDHVTTGLDLVLLEKSVFSFVDLLRPTSPFEYLTRGGGPFASGLVEAVGVVHSPLVDPRRDSPDLQFMILMAGVSSDKGVFLRHTMGISNKVWDDYFYSLINESVISILPVLLHPKSKGEVILDTVDPEGKPKIDPRYLSEKEDVDTIIEGIRIIQRLTKTNAMKKLGAKFNEKKFPGCEMLEFDSNEYWDCYVRHLTLTVYHPVGTCKMGSLSEGGVVDHRLRVHRTSRLRVVDASVMPGMPSANTNAAVVMIAEKGADLIKEDFANRHSSCGFREVWFSDNSCH